MTMGYATKRSVPPSPSTGMNIVEKKRKISEIRPRNASMYRKGEGVIFEEIIADRPPAMNAISANNG